MYFTITGVKKIVRYTEDFVMFVISSFHFSICLVKVSRPALVPLSHAACGPL